MLQTNFFEIDLKKTLQKHIKSAFIKYYEFFEIYIIFMCFVSCC